MKLFADREAKPVAFHKPFAIPLHWQAAVKQQLDNDVKMGVLGKVPLGTPTEWCSRMDGSGDISLRNRRFLRQITPLQSIIQGQTPASVSSGPASPTDSPPLGPRRSRRVRTQTKRFSN